MRGARSVAAVLGVLILCSGAGVPQVQSTFDGGGESWTGLAIWSIDASGNVTADSFNVTWNASSGNPGGCIGFLESPTTRDVFAAPAAFFGTNGSTLGGELSFDLSTTRGSGTTGPQPLVTLVGAGRSLTYRAEVPTAWTHYAVPLNVEGWERFVWGWGNTGSPATQDDLRAVLSNLSGMYIWGDFTGETDEYTRVDNVTMVFNTNTAVLTTAVVGGHGTLSPASGDYTIGAIIFLTAAPDAGYQVQSWTGTNDDTSTAGTNAVTMTGDRSVTVSFEPAPVSSDPGSTDPGSSGSTPGSSDSTQGGTGQTTSDGTGDTTPPPAPRGGCGFGMATLTITAMGGMWLVTRPRARRRDIG